MSSNSIGYVLSSSAASLVVEIGDAKVFEEHKASLQVGRYLKIAEGNTDYVIAVIRQVRGMNDEVDGGLAWKFHIECQPLGTLAGGTDFRRGSSLLPVPLEPVYVTDKKTLDHMFAPTEKYSCPLAPLSVNPDIQLMVDGDAFFGKHVAVLGSTGSGKSCTVARLLHDVVGIADEKNKHAKCQKNSHVIIFDLHSEYRRAFALDAKQNFTLNPLDVDTLSLPYWLMNSEELESLFIESNESNSYNQVSQFKQAVIANKERHNPGVKEMTYDCPVYFSIQEVYNYIANMNREVIGRTPEDGEKPKLADGKLVSSRRDTYFDRIHDFVAASTAAATRATNGPFHGEFNRFLSRLETTMSDRRLRFLLQPKKANGESFKSGDFEAVIKQFLGYLTKSNVTIVDLSGVPFEVMSITVSLVSRLVFDFCFHYSKVRASDKKLNDVPVMIVCEEAHNYVPRNDTVAYRSSRKSIERIAKEGRKYGLSVMIVSQRPSEVSDTILAQCNNFVALRLTNSEDQAYVRHLIPNNLSGVTDVLPNLAQGECLVVGDAVLMPALVRLTPPKPQPQSETVSVYREWQADWRQVVFDGVIKRWRREADVA